MFSPFPTETLNSSRRPFTLCLLLLLVSVTFAGTNQAWSQPSRHRNVQEAADPIPVTRPLGAYYALVIGNSNYLTINKLKTPIKDADAVATLLQDTYGFHIKVLHDATRMDILSALSEYRRTLPENSNLLLYYAGHGYLDPVTHVAYWFPVDAQLENNANWISASDISSDMSAIPSQHILIISDSCYSGQLSLSRDAGAHIDPVDRNAFLQKMMQHKSRTLLASGGNEPVWDGGAEGHSIFAAVLLDSLKQMNQPQFNASDIFVTIQQRVGGRSQQLPQYSSINNSGHDGGDFIFSRTGAAPGPDLNVKLDSTRTFSDAEQTDAISSLLSRYQSAFQDKDIDALARVWPGMPAPTRKANTLFFAHASSIKMTYAMLGKPVFGGDVATVKFSQELVYVANNKEGKLSTPQVTMTLTKAPDQRGTSTSWQIASVR